MKTITLKSGKTISLNQAFNMDCLDFMKELPDKCIDLVLTDPPYGILNKTKRGTQRSPHKYKVRAETWDTKPDQIYFDEIFRISNNQIITGGNYFDLPKNNGWIFWHKRQPIENYSAGELIWTSIDQNIKYLDMQCFGNIGQDKERFHPTQKPTKLFQWLLSKYADEGMIIFDPFIGSFTTAVASHKTGCNWLGCEKDPDYFKSGYHRYEQETKQMLMEF